MAEQAPGRKRVKYEVAGRAMRHSITMARNATPAERVVLSAVHHWTLSYSRISDRVSLGQLAVTAGLWDGPAADCPKKVTRRIGQRLRRLAELGAVEYEPGGGAHGRGYVSTVAVVLDPRDQEKGDPDGDPSAENGDLEGDPFDDQKGDPDGSEGVPAGGQKGDPVGPPPEKSSEKSSEQPASHQPTAREQAEAELARKRARGEEIRNETALLAYLEKQFTKAPPDIPAKIQSARAFAFTYRDRSEEEFAASLRLQSDWAHHPEVLEAAMEAYRDASAEHWESYFNPKVSFR